MKIMDKETLYKYFEGITSKEEEEAVYQWLDSSPENMKELFKERKFFDSMILSGSVDKKGTKIERPDATRVIFKPWVLEVLKIAAVVAITLFCGQYYYNSEKREMLAAMNTLTVPAGQRVNLKLPDGTSVWVNARSKIIYPAIFSGSKREINLDGEAYFEVVHNAKKPFIVHTQKCDVEVLGTKFNVEAYSDSQDFCTSLMQGSVKVYDKSKHLAPVFLKPDQEVNYKNNKLSVSSIGDYDHFRWREGLICFNNMPFNDLMKLFETCYGITIVVKNSSLKDYSCSGKFRISDGLEKALLVLQKNGKYIFKRNKDNTVVFII